MTDAKPKFKKKLQVENAIYDRSLITRSILLPMVVVGKNIQDTIEKYIIENFEGLCVVVRLVKRGSCKIVTYSSGIIRGTNIVFEVVFERQICCPVEGISLRVPFFLFY